MHDNFRDAIIAKYTDKSRYKPKHIFGDVYVDKDRIALSESNRREKKLFDREFKAAKHFSLKYSCEVFMLPPNEGSHAIYIEKNSNPDAIIKGNFIDFKYAEGSDSSITKQLGRGIEQADGIIITIGNDTTIEKAVQWLNGKINSMKKDHSGFMVIIEDRNGNYKSFIINKKRRLEASLPFAARKLSPSNN